MPLFGHKKSDGQSVERDLEDRTRTKPEKGGESVKRTDLKADPAYVEPGQYHNNSHNAQHLRELEREMGTTTHHTGFATTNTVGAGVVTGPAANASYTTAATNASYTTAGTNAGYTSESKMDQLKDKLTPSHHSHKHGADAHLHKHEYVATTGTLPATATLATTSNTAANANVRTERVEHEAALVEEKILRKEQEVIQPVITRDIDRVEVHQISQPIHETTVLPTQQNARVLPEQNIERNLNKGTIAPQVIPETRHIEGEREVSQVTEKPIIQERVHTKVIEDIQPVIYRDVIQPIVTVVQQPVHEHVVEQARIVTETRPIIQGANASSFAQTQTLPLQYQTQQTVVAAPQTFVAAPQTTGGVVHEVFHGEELGRGHLVKEDLGQGKHRNELSRHDRKELEKAQQSMQGLNLNSGPAYAPAGQAL